MTIDTFDTSQQQYLATMERGTLATISPDGAPQNKPVGFHHNRARGTIEIWGYEMERSAKFRNIATNPQVAFTLEDVPDRSADAAGVRFMEIRGRAEQVDLGAPPAPQLSPWAIRIHPRRVLSYNVGEPGLRRRDVADDDRPTTAHPPLALTGASAQHGLEAVQRQVAELQGGLGDGDADTYNRHFAGDVMWGNPYGGTVDGYDTLHESHVSILAGASHARSRYEITRSLAVTPDVVLAQVRRDALDEHGEPVPSRGNESRFSEMALYVLVRRGATWWLAAGQNTKIDLDRGAATR